MTATAAEPTGRIQPAFFRPDQAASYLSISKRHLSDLPIRKAKIGRRCALYAKADLDAFVASLTKGVRK